MLLWGVLGVLCVDICLIIGYNGGFNDRVNCPSKPLRRQLLICVAAVWVVRIRIDHYRGARESERYRVTSGCKLQGRRAGARIVWPMWWMTRPEWTVG